MELIPTNLWTECLTNIKLPLRTPRRIGSERRPQGRSRCHGPEGTTPSRHSSPHAFPSPSTPTRSARTCSTVKRKWVNMTQHAHSTLVLVPVNWLLWQGLSERTGCLSGANLVSTHWVPFAQVIATQVLSERG